MLQLHAQFGLPSRRAGHRIERNLFNPNHPQGAFWLEAHGNFFDISVLEWCKLFADRNRDDWGEHHWRRVVENPDRFEADLYRTLGLTADAFAELIKNIKGYRDQFVAHLDEKREMLLPALETAKKSIAFLHERLVQQADGHGDWSGLPTSPEQLEQGFTHACREARSVYAEAWLASLRSSDEPCRTRYPDAEGLTHARHHHHRRRRACPRG